MESTILTPRLKLTLVHAAERGSQELAWIHELRSNEQSAFWNLGGPAKALEQTEAILKNILPVVSNDSEEKVYRVPYMVHELLPAATPNDITTPEESRFIGLITLRSLTPTETAHPPRATHGSTPTTLSLEIAYMFLPSAWNKGYATEAISSIYTACARAESTGFWAPWEKVCVRAIVNKKNGPSQRVMQKCGMEGPETVIVEGHRVFVAGEWAERHILAVFAKEIVS